MNNGHRCDNIKNHTECPEPMAEWDKWATEKCKTHKQVICWSCGIPVIWELKETAQNEGKNESYL